MVVRFMLNNDARPVHDHSSTAVNSSSWTHTAIAVVMVALIAGTSRYLLGITRTKQNTSKGTQPFTNQQSTIPVILSSPTPFDPEALTPLPTVASFTNIANWNTYTDRQWGISFKYPDTWFYQAVPLSAERADNIDFYPFGATPNPGGVGDPGNAAFIIGPAASQDHLLIDGRSKEHEYKEINIAGKPAVRWRSSCFIKLSGTSWFFLYAPIEVGAKTFDIILSTIKFIEK